MLSLMQQNGLVPLPGEDNKWNADTFKRSAFFPANFYWFCSGPPALQWDVVATLQWFGGENAGGDKGRSTMGTHCCSHTTLVCYSLRCSVTDH